MSMIKDKQDFVTQKKLIKYDSRIFGDESPMNDYDSDTNSHINQNKRIEQMLFKELYQKTIDKGHINFSSHDDMEVMIAAMKKKVKSNKEKVFIISAISQIGVFANHPMIFKEESVTTQLFREIKIEHYTKRSTIFNQGDIGDTYYMIIKGEVNCLIPTSKLQQKVEELLGKKLKKRKKRMNAQQPEATQEEDKMLDLTDEEFLQQKFPTFKVVKTFKQWEGFGDIALITQQYRQNFQLTCIIIYRINIINRTATMVCKDDSYCITMTKSGFDKIIGELSRQQKNTQVKFLKQFPFFSGIPKSKLMSILMDIEVMKYSKNKVLYEERQPISHVFFILEGEVEIYKKLNVEFNQGNIIQQYEKKNKKENQLSKTLGQKNTVTNIRQIGLSIIGPNSYCGIDELFNGNNIRENSARCISTSSTIYVLNKEKFLDSLKVNKQLEKNHSSCIEKNDLLQQRAQNMTDQIQDSLNKICNNISVTSQKQIEEQPEKRTKPLTNPRDIIKERIILNKEILSERMIKQNSSLNNQTSFKLGSQQSQEYGLQKLFKSGSNIILPSNSEVSTDQKAQNHYTKSQFLIPSPIKLKKDANLKIDMSIDSEYSDKNNPSVSPISPEDSSQRISEFFIQSPEKFQSSKDIFLLPPKLSKKTTLSKTLSKFIQQNDSSSILSDQKPKIQLSRSTLSYQNSQQINDNDNEKLENPFNKEEMRQKIDYCEKVNFEKMHRYLSYMKNNNQLKNILTEHKKKVTPSSHMDQYFNQLQKKSLMNNYLSSSLYQEVLTSPKINLFEKQKIFLNQTHTNSTNLSSILNSQTTNVDSYTKQEFTRLQYLNQTFQQKQLNNHKPFQNPSKSLASLYDSSASQMEQRRYLQRSKKISPANFFQDLLMKKEQGKILNAEQKLNKFCKNQLKQESNNFNNLFYKKAQDIGEKRKNISLNWQQKILLNDQNYLDNVNKQETKGLPIQMYIEKKYTDQSLRKNSENGSLDGSSNGTYNSSNGEIKEIHNFDSILEETYYMNSKIKLKLPNKRLLKPLSEQSSPFESRKISINDHYLLQASRYNKQQ